MIPFALIRPFLPAIALAMAVGGAWMWHSGAVGDAFDAGKAEVQNRWEEADRLAVAVGDETSKLLKRGALRNETELQRRLETAGARVAAVAADRVRVVTELDALRVQLDERAAAAPPDDRDSCPAAQRDDIKLRSCEALVAGSLSLASATRGVVDRAEEILTGSDAALTSLQEWARLVQTAQEAP
jgi:hypothetical protein